MMKTLFAELEDHMKSDHLLLRLLVYLSTEDDVDVMLDHTVHVPVCIYALHISNQCQQYNKLCQKKVNYTSVCVCTCVCARVCVYILGCLESEDVPCAGKDMSTRY